jgi:hypothetical protein
MPHRKTFRDLDELVKLTPEERPARPDPTDQTEPEKPDDIHDQLFECAWRKAREQRS